jgi:hypothetical protein
MPITLQPTSRLSLTKILMVGVMLMASPAQGMVYMWRDSAGIAHYSNKEYDIPARYKAKAKALYPEAADSGQIQPQSGNVQASPTVQVQPITSQQAKPPELPKEQPTATPPQIQNSSPRTTSRRERRPRVRSADEE